MRKAVILFLFVLLVFLSACSSDEYKSYYDIADYDRFNSNYSDVTKDLEGKKVHLAGTVNKIEEIYDYLYIEVEDADKNQWLIRVVNMNKKPYTVFFDIGRIISVDGVYSGKGFWRDLPMIEMDKLYANNRYYYPDDFIIQPMNMVESIDNPFFVHSKEIAGNRLDITAGYAQSSSTINVAMICDIDGNNRDLSNAFFASVFADCITLSDAIPIVLLTIHDSSNDEYKYYTFHDGYSYGDDYPSFYENVFKQYDSSVVSSFYSDAENSFKELESAITNEQTK